jgi:hypothetical protein
MYVLELLISLPATTASGGTLPSRHRTHATLQEQSLNGDPTVWSAERRFVFGQLADIVGRLVIEI